MKIDAPQNPSRVLHFRGVPSDATEGEIVQLGLPFGRMTNLVLAKKKNQVSDVILFLFQIVVQLDSVL